MNKRNAFQGANKNMSFAERTHQNATSEKEGSSELDNKSEVPLDSAEDTYENNRGNMQNGNNIGINNVRRNNLPVPPPNYGGMMYDRFDVDDVDAEGIGRIVKNDASYSEYGKRRRENEYRRDGSVSAMGRMRQNIGRGKEKSLSDSDCDTSGLKNLVKGLETKNFSPEDILLGAIILLMLNSSSEDDILMILVLLMLL